MTESLSVRNGHSGITPDHIASPINDYRDIKQVEQAGLVMASLNQIGSCAVYGIAPEQASDFARELEWMAENVYNQSAVSVSHISGDMSEACVEQTFDHIRSFMYKEARYDQDISPYVGAKQAESIVIISNLDALVGEAYAKPTRAQEVARRCLAGLMSQNQSKICVMTAEASPEAVPRLNDEKYQLLGSFAAHHSFTAAVAISHQQESLQDSEPNISEVEEARELQYA